MQNDKKQCFGTYTNVLPKSLDCEKCEDHAACIIKRNITLGVCKCPHNKFCSPGRQQMITASGYTNEECMFYKNYSKGGS
jgi:hypothetical protein